MSSMKQGTLSFASAKRSNSATNGKTKSASTTTHEKDKTQRKDMPIEKLSGSRPGAVVEIFSGSDEEDTLAVETTVPAKRTRSGTKARSSAGTTKQASAQTSMFEKQELAPVEVAREHLDVEDKAGRYRRYYNEVRSKMGYMQPIHSEGQNKIHQILRFFDMSYEFGPCIGMTRLKRWERAEAFGLNPPVEVRDILLTKEGVEKAEYAQCVLHDEV